MDGWVNSQSTFLRRKYYCQTPGPGAELSQSQMMQLCASVMRLWDTCPECWTRVTSGTGLLRAHLIFRLNVTDVTEAHYVHLLRYLYPRLSTVWWWLVLSGETQSEARVTTEAGAYDGALGLLCVIGGPVSPDRRNGPPCVDYIFCGWSRPGDFPWLIVTAMTRAIYHSIEY